jgi:glycosyltransferase involved in cell wall biosynthesis
MPPRHPYRILHIITRLDLGGSAENTLLTAIGLAKKGYAVTIICGQSDNPPSRNEQKALTAGVKVIRMRSLVRDIAPIADVAALLRLWWHVVTNRYDIVHTHTSKAGVLGRIAVRFSRVKRVVHTPHGHIFYGYFSAILTGFFVWVEWLLMRWTALQITLTHKEMLDYLAHGIGPEEKMVPVYSGIELQPFLACTCDRAKKRAELGIESQHFVAGTVARLVRVKNHQLVIQALDILRERAPLLRFVFVGDGELRDSLETQIQSLGLESRVVFTGWREDVAELLSAFDLFVMVSKNEGMGRAFVEAQASGVPVIGSRVGGVAEVMSAGETGYLVEPEDAQDLADKIEHLYNNRERLERMAAKCREWVKPRFGHDVMIERIESLYRQLLQPSDGGPEARRCL